MGTLYRFLLSGERCAPENVNSSKNTMSNEEAGDIGQEQHRNVVPAGELDVSKVNELMGNLQKNDTLSSESDQRANTSI